MLKHQFSSTFNAASFRLACSLAAALACLGHASAVYAGSDAATPAQEKVTVYTAPLYGVMQGTPLSETTCPKSAPTFFNTLRNQPQSLQGTVPAFIPPPALPSALRSDAEAKPAPAARTRTRRSSSREVVINGIRPSLQQSLTVKRHAASIVEPVTAEDVGKMPDKNVTDSLVRMPAAPVIVAGMPAPAAPAETAAPGEVPGPVRAGFVDDNADFGEFQRYLARNAQLQGYRYRDVAERYKVIVRDGHHRPVPNALISATIGQDTVVWARTDQKGAVWFAPNAVFDPKMHNKDILLSAEADGKHGQVTLERGQKNAATIEIDAQPASAPRLDLVLLIDTTGSMGDEISKLRHSLSTILDRVNHLPSRPDLCLGIVAYKDHEDDYVTKGLHLTSDVNRVQQELDSLSAGGGGDEPEALNEALEVAVQDLKWRDGNTARLIVLVTDAPPKMAYPAPYYDQIATAALQKGIRIHSVGASGLSREGELVLRQIAQYTGGKFVFLTYKNPSNPSEGSGDKTDHDVSNYSVDTLDDLIVRLVREDLSNGAD